MALDPRIALAGTYTPIQTPDLLRTLLGAQQMQENMQQLQLRSLQLSELVKSQEQERQMMDYLRARYAAQQPPGSNLAGLVGPSPFAASAQAGPITQTAFGASDAGPSERFPTVVPSRDPSQPATLDYGGASPAPQGMPPDSIEARIAAARAQGAIPQVAEASPLPQEIPQVAGASPLPPEVPQVAGTAQAGPPLPGMTARTAGPGAPMAAPTWQEMVPFGKSGREMLQVIQQQEAGQAQTRLRQMETLAKGVETLEKAFPLIADQQSLDQVRTLLPDMASALPTTYDKADMDQRMTRLQQMKSKLASTQYGLTPVQVTDKDGNQRIIQMSSTGVAKETELPPGTTISPHVQKFDTPLETILYDTRSGQVVSRTRKDVYGGEQEKQQAQEDVKQVEEARTRLRTGQTTLAQLDRKHQTIRENLDAIFAELQTPTGQRGFVVGPGGVLPSKTPGTSAYRVRVLLGKIGAALGLEELTQLKATGGTLGPVSNAEHELLRAAAGSLDQGLDLQAFWANAEKLYGILDANKQRLREAYDRDSAELEQRYQNIQRRGAQPSRTGPSQSSNSGQVKGRISKAQQADIFASDAFKKSGVTPEQAIAGWRQQGLEVEP